MYVGAEIDRVLEARTPEEAVLLATEQWANVQATDFPARAGAIAAGIAARRPQLVGLQEVALYRTTDRPFEELATHVAYDFLQLVIDSLHARGLDYVAAAVDRTTDLQVPVIARFDASGQPVFAGVRFTDGDAVLLRADVPHANARSGVYQGWSSVEATIGGATYRFVVTHLAGQEVAELQVAQTRELVALLADDSRPTVLVGDFAGYADSWIEPDRRAPGLTCCERPDLLNPVPAFDQRIDFIFTRNLPAGAPALGRDVVGDRPGDRTAGLWPSDHAGVVATFRAPR